ncbi:hypothetical protein CTI12_AA104310 [Artemisia annua]|uniref:Uncharacterized protein n=1 Tax=Artemisia annua TaxID=35608 RepID=A0A2U1PWI9_ARTAN|nr:hypothetical protein CTI12_AA104310 [Artemisia annua]
MVLVWYQLLKANILRSSIGGKICLVIGEVAYAAFILTIITHKIFDIELLVLNITFSCWCCSLAQFLSRKVKRLLTGKIPILLNVHTALSTKNSITHA